jgi:cobalt-zinc-cadmium efflux system outer membrane protein
VENRARLRGGAVALMVAIVVWIGMPAAADDLNLQELIDEALQNSPEILATRARSAAAGHRVPQARSLPDPMLMTGYQNEGLTNYSYGDAQGAQWMFSASQMFPFPGKLGLKGDMAAAEAAGVAANAETIRLKVIGRVKDLYYGLFLAYKTLDILNERAALFTRTEEAALARYASGMGQQQDALMAQTEKYMILEREGMQRQRIQSFESMLNSTVGRDVTAPLGRPPEPRQTPFERSLDELIQAARPKSRSRSRWSRRPRPSSPWRARNTTRM